MQKKKQTKPIKQIIIFIAIIILLLLLVFAEDIIKLTNKNKLKLAENLENELISNEPNPPQLSAGMIPVKWDGTNWIITTSKDKDWYDYSKGKPAYIMLNDGYYQSELIRDMINKELAENNVGNDALVVPNISNNNPTMLMWIPRFVYKESGEIGYIKEETILGEGWILPDLFTYKITDNTKPDFSLSGIWLEKDVDTNYTNKITQMNREESIYGFIANTKPRQITLTDINELQKYVGNDATVVPSIIDLTNINRIILQIINDKKHEPIKANITQSTTEGRIEIRVTYTSNGIKEILDEYGNQMTLTEEDRVIYTDTGDLELARGTYKFTVIDNKGNKKELRITPTINSLFKVVYINGTDNMDNTNTYTKTQQSKTTAENTLINQLKSNDSTKTYSRAITDSNKAITAITQIGRTSEDEQMYLYGKYNANSTTKYSWSVEITEKVSWTKSPLETFGIQTIKTDSSTGVVTLGLSSYLGGNSTLYSLGSSLSDNGWGTTKTGVGYYKWTGYSRSSKTINRTYYRCEKKTTYARGNLNSTVIAKDGTYTIGSTTQVHSDKYWYVRNSLAPKYTLQKYDSTLKLQSTYDVDTKILTTAPINISNKGNNKVKLTLNATGIDYKTYISNDNTNWQEVTDITSNTPKELNVDGWDNLFIKIETNTSRINNIDVAFYKD